MSYSYSVEDVQLASEATNLYYSGQLAACLGNLRKLAATKPSDPKVLLNKALVEFLHLFNTTRSDDYLCQLQNVATLVGAPILLTETSETKRAEPAVSQLPVDELGTSLQPTNPSVSPVAMISHYNYSLVLFYQRQYSQSERLLAGLLGLEAFSNTTKSAPTTKLISSIQFPTSAGSLLCQRIILLWLEVTLYLQRAHRVFEVTCALLQVISGEDAPTPIKSSADAAIGTVFQTSPTFSPQVIDMLRTIGTPLRLFRLRSCLLTGRLQEAAKDAPSTVMSPWEGTYASRTGDKDTATGEISPPPTPAKKTDAPAHPSTDSDEHKVPDVSQCSAFVAAQLSYLQGAQAETIKRLNALCSSFPFTDSGQWESILVWNNLSLAHFSSGHFALSSLKLRRALRETDKLAAEVLLALPSARGNSASAAVAAPSASVGSASTGFSPLHQQATLDQRNLVRHTALRTFSSSQHYALLHNSGIQLLFAHKPAAAFAALLSVVDIYPRNPRLWLRLAECCIKVQRPDNLSDWKLDARANCLVGTFGSGCMRKLVVGAGGQEPVKPWIESASMSAPTLEFAALCLRNALLLLPRPPAQFSELDSTLDCNVDRQRAALIEWAENQTVSTLPSLVPLSGLALLQLISSVLLNTAYVALCLRNPVETIHAAEQVLHTGTPPSFCNMRNSDSVSEPATMAGPEGAKEKGASATSENTTCLPAVFGWIGLIAPPAHRYLAKMYLAEAYTCLDDLPNACGILLTEDLVGTGESLSLLSLHSIDSYRQLKRGRASLAPPFLLPQTHQQCGLKTNLDAFSERQKSSLDIKSEQERPVSTSTVSSTGQREVRHPDFPVTVEQAIGVLLYNMAVCCAVRGDYSMSRHLLENAAPALLASDHSSWDPYSPLICHGSEEHRNLLYPNPLVPFHQSSSDLEGRLAPPPSPRTFLPAHFIRLWLYLDLSAGRLSAALNFVRSHLGHVAKAGGRLTDPTLYSLFSSFSRSRTISRNPNSMVLFEIDDGGGGGGLDGGGPAGFCESQPSSGTAYLSAPNSTTVEPVVLGRDGGLHERVQMLQRLAALQQQQQQKKKQQQMRQSHSFTLQIQESPAGGSTGTVNTASNPPQQPSSWQIGASGHWGVTTNNSSVLAPNDSEWPPL
uniref:CCR4-NOT transcription complex subunit 10 n=2 Tax=Diphyllobothriidae TaxID=28843 RepID=A0A0X3NUZ1_SCHSO